MRKVFFTLLLALSALTAESAETLNLCQDEIEESPWRTVDYRGLNNILLNMVAKKTDLVIKTSNLPWKRCLAMVQDGEMDGAIAASFREERKAIGVYPTTHSGSVPDRNRRLSGESYHFYKLKNGKFTWDGNTISGAGRPVAVQMGYSAVQRLREKNILTDDRERRPEQLLRKVLMGMVSAALLAPGEGDKWVNRAPFSRKIEKVNPPFFQTDGYLLLSHQFVNANRKTAESIWDAIGSVRNSMAYRHEMAQRGITQSDP